MDANGNEVATIAGKDEHDTKFGCESGAGGCRLACGAGGCGSVGFEAGKELGGTQAEFAQSCKVSSTAGGFDRWTDAPEEGRSGTDDNTPIESDPKETTDWQVAKVRRGKLRQPRGVSKSVQQRAEERKEIESLLGTIRDVRRLTPDVQALVNGEVMIAKFQARIQELQAGLHQDCL